MVEKCSGHDGTWAMKVEYFDESMKVGKKLFDPLLAATRPSVIASDCALASVQIHQGTSRRREAPRSRCCATPTGSARLTPRTRERRAR